jgi:hypothetical protein
MSRRSCVTTVSSSHLTSLNIVYVAVSDRKKFIYMNVEHFPVAHHPYRIG